MERFRIEIRHAIGVGEVDAALPHVAVNLAQAQKRIVVTVIAQEQDFHPARRRGTGIGRLFTRCPNVCSAGHQEDDRAECQCCPEAVAPLITAVFLIRLFLHRSYSERTVRTSTPRADGKELRNRQCG